MFDWLFEGPWWVYLTLAIPAVALIGLWTRDRKAGWLYGLAVVVLLGLIVFVCDYAIETRNEQIGRKLQAMAAAVKNRDVDTIFQHISPTFRFGAKDKAAFRRSVESVMPGVDDLIIWDTKFTDTQDRVTFKAKPRGSLPGSDMFWQVRAEFVQDSDKQWRMRGFEVSDPYRGEVIDVGRFLP